MEKRTLLALALIMLVFWISNQFIWKSKPVVTENQTVETSTEEPIEETQNPISSREEIVQTDLDEYQSDVEINNDIILENEFIRINFSNQGGVITSVTAKNYTYKETGYPVDLIPVDKRIFDISLSQTNGNSTLLTNKVFHYETISGDQGIIFSLPMEEGILTKTFVLKDNYVIDAIIKTENLNLSKYNLKFDSGIADTEEYVIKHPKEKLRDYKFIAQVNNEIKKFSLSKLKEERSETGTIDWLALRSKYFVIGLSLDELVSSEKVYAFNSQNSPAGNVDIAVNRTSIEHSFKMYFGPLLSTNLKSFREGFQKTKEGPFIEILRPIANGFNWIFKQLRKVIPSYGLIVIIIAVVLKILLYPLTHKSFESTQKMQKINPLMKEIQRKYKENPQKMNSELKNLYKEQGVSPLGGCLPMLLQMPIIFAIYPVIRYSIDMRQASFLWLPDLSEPDQLLILPIAMAIFMFVQQKLMAPPKASVEDMDEKQQAAQQSQKMMMYIMPVMMFFIFKSLSSGLVLYWTVFSIIGTIQQYFIKKKFN